MSNSGESEPRTPKFCPSCGKQVKREKARFCSQCGRDFFAKVDDPVSAGQSPVPSTGSAATMSGRSPSTGQGSQPSSIVPSQQASSSQSFPSGSGSLYQQESQPPQRWKLVTPNDIRPVSGQIFTRDEFVVIGFFALAAFGSHILRYMLLFNTFPDIVSFLLPIPFYGAAVAIIFFIQKAFMRSQGVQVDLKSNRFDYSRSLVFSSFFLTLLPPRMIINKEVSTMPDKISIPEGTQYGISYREVPAARYVGSIVRPRMHFLSNLFISFVALVVLIMHFNADNEAFSTTARLVSIYISSFVIVELAPIFGRNNEKSGDYGKLRTLVLFLFSLILFLLGLLGETIVVTLQDRF